MYLFTKTYTGQIQSQVFQYQTHNKELSLLV